MGRPVTKQPLARVRTPGSSAVDSRGSADRAIGVFDSGVGGLTVVRAVQELLPAEDILYLGDTARLPYGSKSPETIRHFADEDARFLIERGVKAIVVACNTATAHALPGLREKYRLPILGVIDAGVESALSIPGAERIGIIATRGTIQSHAYQHALAMRQQKSGGGVCEPDPEGSPAIKSCKGARKLGLVSSDFIAFELRGSDVADLLVGTG